MSAIVKHPATAPVSDHDLVVINVEIQKSPHQRYEYFLVDGSKMTLEEFVRRKLPSPDMIPDRVGHSKLTQKMWKQPLKHLLQQDTASTATTTGGDAVMCHENCEYPQLCLTDVHDPTIDHLKVARGGGTSTFVMEAEELQ